MVWIVGYSLNPLQIISDIVFLTKSAEKLEEVSEFGETGHPMKENVSINWSTPQLCNMENSMEGL